MKQLLKTWCRSTFVMLMVVALSSVAMAQYGGGKGHDHTGGEGFTGGRPPMPPRDAQPQNLYEEMKAQNVPSTIRAEDLTADWHIIQVGMLTQFSRTYYNSQVTSVYFTQGSVLSFEEKEYLVAYHVQPSSDQQERMAQEDALKTLERFADSSSSPGSSVALYKGSTLAVSLFPLDTAYQIHEIKQLNPQKDIGVYPTGTQEARLRSQSNLKQIALATLMYTQDYDEKFPPMVAAHSKSDFAGRANTPGANITNKTTVQERLLPYARSDAQFLQPATGRPYLPNYKISRHSMADVRDVASTFLFYEDAPDADGMRNVAYADGHVKAITEAEFQRERQAQHISKSGYPSAAKLTQKAKVTPKP